MGSGTGFWCNRVAFNFPEIRAVHGVDISLRVEKRVLDACHFHLCKFPDGLREIFQDDSASLVQSRYVVD